MTHRSRQEMIKVIEKFNSLSPLCDMPKIEQDSELDRCIAFLFPGRGRTDLHGLHWIAFGEYVSELVSARQGVGELPADRPPE